MRLIGYKAYHNAHHYVLYVFGKDGLQVNPIVDDLAKHASFYLLLGDELALVSCRLNRR